MKTYILVGGIGSGKSTVSDLFAEKGAHCLDLDDVGHEVLLQDEVVSLLVDTFGAVVLNADGSIDRASLAARAFAEPSETVKLNAITQPRLAKLAQQHLSDLEADGCSLAIVEISAYDGPEGTFAPFVRDAQGVIAVVAPKKLRIERAVAKGFDSADVENRIARQVDDVQRQLWADFVIKNDSTLEDLQQRVGEVWSKIAE